MPRTTSGDTRPRVDCSKGVKTELRIVRDTLKCDSDSETIAYLLALYKDAYDKITLVKDKQYREKANEIDRQQSF
ncbi:hypothetical protein [Paenibacillus brasilensis]|uniref:Uncharacterized protein n=1 Tax=Paenibacillus brasilensis TaxID=128574 RepID=A0ABU0L6G2_9BACL|nr:hypothetical protein [Paenibacillus brasilensis]MDQ0496887.1 hypothetical protein [Paenibacillus brasilensis]